MNNMPPFPLPEFNGDLDRWLHQLALAARDSLGLRGELTVQKAREVLKGHLRVPAWGDPDE